MSKWLSKDSSSSALSSFRFIILFVSIASAHLLQAASLLKQESLQTDAQWNSNITQSLFLELEQLSRVVDIAYCVGTTGISHPFNCASHCSDFPDFEIVDTFHSLPGNSCGYIALDHSSDGTEGRILVVFRGTYSIPDTILDLSTLPQEYVPYPSDDYHPYMHTVFSYLKKLMRGHTIFRHLRWPHKLQSSYERVRDVHFSAKCINCTVHMGFWASYQSIRPQIIPQIQSLFQMHPNYQIYLVGHSLGGAVAALAALDLHALGYAPIVTTFGEPRVGNSGLRDYIDTIFNLPSEDVVGQRSISGIESRYRRVTHQDDPVPLLPLQEWGFRAHAGEIFIAKPHLRPEVQDVRLCFGNDDMHCIVGAEVSESWFPSADTLTTEPDTYGLVDISDSQVTPAHPDLLIGGDLKRKRHIRVPPRGRIWQLFFAHRDYFWRLGVCLPGGDPVDWGRPRYGGHD